MKTKHFHYANILQFPYISFFPVKKVDLLIFWMQLPAFYHRVYLYLLHHFRGIYTKKVTISREFLSCTKKSIYYTDTDVKMSEDSTYQELDISRDEIPYQNTTIHWFLRRKKKYDLDFIFSKYHLSIMNSN